LSAAASAARSRRCRSRFRRVDQVGADRLGSGHAGGLAELAGEIVRQCPHGRGAFDLVVEIDPRDESRSWRDAAATWVLTGFGRQPREAEVRKVIADDRL
jgi:hypothetical protein